jgi:hypothetical protein
VSRIGDTRREEALAASQEAVDIYRRLAATRPNASLPDLAMSLRAHSNTLAALDRHQEAARIAAEALRIIFAVCRALSIWGLARTTTADVRRYNDVAGPGSA